jgi:hypothetical protein
MNWDYTTTILKKDRWAIFTSRAYRLNASTCTKVHCYILHILNFHTGLWITLSKFLGIELVKNIVNISLNKLP